MMLKLSHHIVTWFARANKVVVFCNLLTTANSDRKTTEKSRNYSSTAKWFARIAIVCVEFRKHHIYTWKLVKLFSCTQKKLNPLNLLTCMDTLFIACYYWKQFFFGMLHSHLLTACFCHEQQSSCFGNNECFWHNLQPKQKVVHGPWRIMQWYQSIWGIPWLLHWTWSLWFFMLIVTLNYFPAKSILQIVCNTFS